MPTLTKSKTHIANFFLSVALFAIPSQSGMADTLYPDPNTAPDGAVMAAWTQITGSSGLDYTLEGMARFVITGTGEDCTAFELKTSSGTQQNLFIPRDNLVPSKFPVTVCEAAFDPNWTSAELQQDGKNIDLWSPVPGEPAIQATFPTLYSVGRNHSGTIKLAGFGDAGCRDDSGQSCATQADWPFATLAASAAGEKPDLVVHVGDYRYSNKGHSDRWEYWYQEFFYPAQSLLQAAPWAFTRGNHEACGYDSTADKEAPWGTGWFYLLQHNDNANSVNCTDSNDEYRPPWYFDVAMKSGKTPTDPHRFIIMDSSVDDPSSQQVANFKTMIDQSNDAESSWWVGHRPIWGINTYTATPLEQNLEQDLTTAINELGSKSPCWPEDNLPCSLNTMLAGHIHVVERVQFYGQNNEWIRPQQHVVGNSGVQLAPGMNASPCTLTIASSAPATYGANLTGTADWDQEFGYVIWERDPAEQAGWSETRHFYVHGQITSSVPKQTSATATYPTCSITQ